MFEKLVKWGGGVAALCLLCCAAPLTLAFATGGSAAAYGLWAGEPGLATEVFVLLGILAMAVSAWMILRRRRLSGPACDVK